MMALMELQAEVVRGGRGVGKGHVVESGTGCRRIRMEAIGQLGTLRWLAFGFAKGWAWARERSGVALASEGIQACARDRSSVIAGYGMD